MKLTLSGMFSILIAAQLNLSNAVAQQPGGVAGMRLWLKAVPSGQGAFIKDFSLHYPNLPGKLHKSVFLNFHPAVWLSENNTIYEYAFPNLAIDQSTIISALYPTYDNIKEKPESLIEFKSADRHINIDIDAVDTSRKAGIRQTILDFGKGRRNNFVLGPGTTVFNAFKSAVYQPVMKSPPKSIWMPKRLTTLSTRNEIVMPELMIYTRRLLPNEIWRVQSHLAIKYAFTLDTSYSGSVPGETLWDINDKLLASYQNRVAAIGKDSNGALFQPKATTSYEEAYQTSEYSSDGRDDNDLFSDRRILSKVPATDSSSITRSLTVSFTDKKMNQVPDGAFLFWGDNNAETVAEEIDKVNYPNLLAVKRNWLFYNKRNIKAGLKLEVSGEVHDQLYNPYDYQKFRYVLVRLKADARTIDTTYLFDYFARYHFIKTGRSYFYNSGIVWEKVSLPFTSNNPYQRLTFAKVPLLRVKTINGYVLPFNNYEAGKPISSGQPPFKDPVEIVFKKNSPLILNIQFTSGVRPYVYTFRKQSGGPNPSAGTVQQDTQNPQNSKPNEDEQEDEGKPTDIQEGQSTITISSELVTDVVYEFRLTDKVGQAVVLPIKLVRKK